MAEWSAEVVVDEALVHRLLFQFPELEPTSLEPLAEGWDNAVWLVDGTWAFRFPRRAIAVPGVRRELAVLPRLAPLLPLPVPTPAFVGEPDVDYPWPFFGAAFLPGREPAEAGLDDHARAGLARPLAAFLRRLHGVDRAELEGAGLPLDPNRRADMAYRVRRTHERLDELEQRGLWRTPRAARDLVDRALGLPPPAPVALAHGDLHARHLLVGEGGELAGVIDWGDVCLADPAIDLLLLWSLLPAVARPAFLETYGPVTEAQLVRSWVLALFLSASLALYARAEGFAALERESLAGLARALDEPPG